METDRVSNTHASMDQLLAFCPLLPSEGGRWVLGGEGRAPQVNEFQVQLRVVHNGVGPPPTIRGPSLALGASDGVVMILVVVRMMVVEETQGGQLAYVQTFFLKKQCEQIQVYNTGKLLVDETFQIFSSLSIVCYNTLNKQGSTFFFSQNIKSNDELPKLKKIKEKLSSPRAETGLHHCSTQTDDAKRETAQRIKLASYAVLLFTQKEQASTWFSSYAFLNLIINLAPTHIQKARLPPVYSVESNITARIIFSSAKKSTPHQLKKMSLLSLSSNL